MCREHNIETSRSLLRKKRNIKQKIRHRTLCCRLYSATITIVCAYIVKLDQSSSLEKYKKKIRKKIFVLFSNLRWWCSRWSSESCKLFQLFPFFSLRSLFLFHSCIMLWVVSEWFIYLWLLGDSYVRGILIITAGMREERK
jgi:hypothetical protein